MQIEIDKERFSEWLEVKGLSKQSIEKYLEYFERFNIQQLSHEYMISFLKRYNNSISRAFLSNVFTYIRTADYPKEVKVHIADFVIPKVTGRKKRIIPDVLSKEEVHELSKAMNNRRNTLMVLVQFYGGLRVSELCGIHPWDFNWRYWVAHPSDNGKLKLTYGVKGNKQRIVFMPRFLMKILYQYIRTTPGINKNNPLFKIKANTYLKIIYEASDKLQFNKHIKTHTIRHSCANWLGDDLGWDAFEIMEYLGHEDIATTKMYRQVSKKKLKEKFDEAF
ncbi:MAG TPA: tyrosine-type recombinase/integrase [Candidatus Nanoarchaeia archaeon]|nr:tyrosine-type recombinase/integrase [Candidatus Nanoarchaeia archaeon]